MSKRINKIWNIGVLEYWMPPSFHHSIIPSFLVSLLVSITVGCGSDTDLLKQSLQSQTGYKNITPEELKAKLDAGEDFILIDVRSRSSYEAGHILGAVSIPLDDLTVGAIHKSPLLDYSKEIVVYCQIGVTSISACELLVSSGFSNVKNLIGGISEWKYGLVVRASMIIV